MGNLMKLAESGIKQTVEETGEYIDAEPIVTKQGTRSRSNTAKRSSSAGKTKTRLAPIPAHYTEQHAK